MREDDYTGVPIEDDDEILDLEINGLFEVGLEETVIYDDDENEMVIHLEGAADGAKSLEEAAQMLYDFADGLVIMSQDGWEIIDDIANGHGIAVKFSAFEEEDGV